MEIVEHHVFTHTALDRLVEAYQSADYKEIERTGTTIIFMRPNPWFLTSATTKVIITLEEGK